MLRIKMSIVPGALLSIYVQNISKLYSVLLTKYEKEDDWDSVESLDNLMLSKLPEFQYTDHLEAQERACNLVEIIQFVDERHSEREKMSESFASLFEGELNPVASKAQRRVPIPEGLNLDEWINEPEEDTADEESDFEPDVTFPTMSGQQPITTSPSASPVKVNGKKQKHQHDMELEIEEIRRKRQQEQENNPYYVKSDSKPSPSGAVAAMKKSKSGIDRSESLQTAISELQSPLEIPGVIGLHSYLQQQSSTISWKDAAKNTSDKKKKKGKKGSKTKGSGKSRKRTTVSSSDDNADDSFVIHQVNRDDGEMPEGALSSDNEEQKKRNGSCNDEFKALDMNLDEPLRDDEKLFIPKPYIKAEDDYSMYSLPKNEKPHIRPETTAAEKNGEEKKKKSKKPKKSSSEKVSKKEKQRKRKKSEKSIEENYTSLSSTAKPSSSKVEELIIPEDTTTVIPSSNGFGQTATPKKLETLAQNGDLKILGNVIFKSSEISSIESGGEKNELRGNATIKFKNKGSDTIRRLELSVFESEQVKLDMSSGIKDASSIMLPFELTNKASNEHVLHFEFNKIDKTQKIRVTLMYCIEKSDGHNSEDRLNFTLTFPSIKFLNYATIGETSYKFIVGDLAGSASEKVPSTQSFDIVIDKITKLSNLSVVELLNDENEAASLYAHSYDDSPVCILIKKLPNKYAIDVRCMDSTLANSIAHDLKEIISKNGD
uniref:AP-3 complex subunit delta domain-containing protein n=1 Tax=Panagrolaimus davidi TaxID=227884 RepID=A0A914QJC6_9BILA